ncbi:putative bifunctional diguanylate cyclase/phosphodiesterase [Pseudocolwellia sp. HL-MZ7]|uniref:putative bifunctional diguanylate cyclase/phosphodiesterase n=1 Tax=Pseudocolwellia sp. HL-MZ7 TaxID=3400627 RepID=UPI003CF3DE0D
MTETNSKLNKFMQRDAAVILYGNAVAGILISLLTSSFLVFAFSYPRIDPLKKIWWWVMTCLLLIRFFDMIWWEVKLKKTQFDGNIATIRFITGANLTALMWSVYLVYCTTQGNDIELTTTIIAIAAMAGGSSTVLAAHKYTAIFFPCILLTPGSIGLILSDQKHLQLLGILGLSFSIVMLVISRNSAKFTANTLFLKNENSILVHQMEEKVKQRTHKIYELSNLDPLTRLFNRTAFLEQLKVVTTTPQKPFALLFIDLDGFKKINDSIGHKAGDDILRETANRLSQFTKDSQLLCRWGGDEFLIVFSDIDEASAVEKSKQLIALLSEPHNTENSILSVGATIGIALYPIHAKTEDRLIQLADMAMYYQKKQMRSAVCVFTEEMEKLFAYDLHLKNGLTKAIENKQLRLVFQPIICSKTLNIAAFEALLRWQLDDENIPPDEFIPIAEQYGLIHEIGAWVLQHACMQAKQWDNKREIIVCVNVSIIQLQDENFIGIVEEALSSSLLPAELLHIEITESVFASDLVVITNQIKSLQSMGVQVSIDDFGTGYSSLSAMQDLAVNMVKIDRSFVNKVDSNGKAIISAVMHMSSALNFTVIAEGVETEEQSQALLQLGVHYFQGYYYSRPIEIENIPSYLESKHSNTA